MSALASEEEEALSLDTPCSSSGPPVPALHSKSHVPGSACSVPVRAPSPGCTSRVRQLFLVWKLPVQDAGFYYINIEAQAPPLSGTDPYTLPQALAPTKETGLPAPPPRSRGSSRCQEHHSAASTGRSCARKGSRFRCAKRPLPTPSASHSRDQAAREFSWLPVRLELCLQRDSGRQLRGPVPQSA